MPEAKFSWRMFLFSIPISIVLWAICAGAAVLITGCTAAPKPTLQTQTVEVQVMKPCVPKAVKDGAPAHYPDEGVEGDPDPANRYLRIATANQMRAKRLAVVEPVIATCP